MTEVYSIAAMAAAVLLVAEWSRRFKIRHQGSASSDWYHVTKYTVLCTLGVFSLVLASGCTAKSAGVLVDRGVLVSAQFGADSPGPSQRVLDALSSSVAPSEAALVQAYCFDAGKAIGHRDSLGVVFVGTNEQLVRVGELVESGEADADLAALVEADLLQSGAVDFGSKYIDAGYSADDVAGYLELRGEPPSPGSVERFLSFVEVVTGDQQRLVIADRSQLATTTLASKDFKWAGSGPRYVLDGVVELREMSGEACAESPPS